MTKCISVIDGDLVAFRAAAANESRSIRATHKETGQVTEHAHRTALKEHIKGTFELDEFEIEDVQRAEDIKFALHAIKTTIQGLCKTCEADEYEVYLSGETNFRDSLPLPTRYKSNRDGGLRPLQLKECREYLSKHHEAIRADNCEADDMLAQRCYEGLKQGVKTIACTIDGDQNGVAGWMYNWTKQQEPKLVQGLGEIELIKKNKDFDGYGRKFFYAQWVLGDVTDCFKPSEISGKNFGVVSMYKLLGECKTDQECVEAIYKQYKAWYPGEVVYTDWAGKEQKTDAISLMDLYAGCCHMKRWPEDKIDTRKLLNKLGINH